ncbi:lymphocyte expansion molecule-like [Hyposmocoma kahamanoa]|uniref:lymphocyte expansion molecule-like n=1 Tax=Hyposmocoma kahamanoa TaxID=1477025 RepID=UPI000E6D608E|nr:lymphocyte expansion molecule-like [Hyposmocoma kahamanoa]
MVTKTSSSLNKEKSKTRILSKELSKQVSSSGYSLNSKTLVAKLIANEVSTKDILKIIASQESFAYPDLKDKAIVAKPVSLAFGSKVPRDTRPPVHPKLDPSGLYSTRPLGCDPCLYHPKPIEMTCNSKTIKKEPWQCKTELESWSKNLGYRNQYILKQRRWQSAIGGPAWTNVPDEVKYEPACKNVGFGRTPRFKPPKLSYPGPGTYYKAVPYKVSYGPHSTRPTFEREEPCRFKDTTQKWSLPPNIYRIIDKDSIENKPKKLVSRRGPYELFSGQRDEYSIHNHFASNRCSATTWPIALPGCLEKYKKGHFGEMNKTNMDNPPTNRIAVNNLASCKRRKEEPGPASYDVGDPPIRTFKQNIYGFNSSYDRPPGSALARNRDGVMKYASRDISKYSLYLGILVICQITV